MTYARNSFFVSVSDLDGAFSVILNRFINFIPAALRLVVGHASGGNVPVDGSATKRRMVERYD
jgi:hypothetical protein